MCENDTCTVDPSVLELIRDLAQALQAHHLAYAVSEPVAGAYARDINDLSLITQAEDFLSIARDKPQLWGIPETSGVQE